jgi:4-hydroxy-4-methyl-2-oxoglutarate aldolase
MRASVLGLGEAGSLYATGLVDRGWTVTGFDPVSSAHPEGLVRADTAAAAVEGADIVLSLVGGRHAAGAAESVAAALDPDAVFVDMNTADAATKRAIAETVGAHRFADVSVIGSVPAYKSAAGVVISGAAAEAAEKVFVSLGASTENIGGEPGDASARKLLRSVFMKGLGALIVEATEAGRAAGAEPWIRAQIATELSGGDAALDRLLTGTLKHAARRGVETAAAADLVATLGVRPVMARAAAEVHRAAADTALYETADLLADLKEVPVANIGDARDRMGMCDGGIHSLWQGAKIAGRARTVWTRSGDNEAIGRAISRCQPGDVLVVNGNGDTSRALVGELIAERLRVRGVAGMIIDGAVRDVAELEKIGFGVWARGVSPAGPYKFGPGQLDVPIAVGGVVVNPGDLIVADDDGVIVIPPAEGVASLLGGRAVLDKETKVRASIVAGENR